MHDKSVRPARLDEAKAIANLVRGSISELCLDDQDDDDSRLDQWLADKTENDIAAMIADDTLSFYVIGCSTGLAAAGCHRDDGVILMNYVSPFYRFQGLSARMIGFLEDSIAAQGRATARLVSTRTAITFYEDRGWHSDGDPIPCMGIASQPMKTDLMQPSAVKHQTAD